MRALKNLFSASCLSELISEQSEAKTVTILLKILLSVFINWSRLVCSYGSSWNNKDFMKNHRKNSFLHQIMIKLSCCTFHSLKSFLFFIFYLYYKFSVDLKFLNQFFKIILCFVLILYQHDSGVFNMYISIPYLIGNFDMIMIYSLTSTV